MIPEILEVIANTVGALDHSQSKNSHSNIEKKNRHILLEGTLIIFLIILLASLVAYLTYKLISQNDINT